MARASNNSCDEILEQRLVADIGSGDKDALRTLYQRYDSKLGSFLRQRLFSETLADEAYNDVMYVVWNKAAEFKQRSKVSTWIFGIAYRVSLANSRKELKHVSQQSDTDYASVAELQESDASQALRGVLHELSTDHRATIELAYYYGFSMDEIAQITETPSNTVKTRLFHARKHLKKAMERELDLNQPVSSDE